MHSKQILVWTRVWTVFLVIFQMFSPLFLALASYVPVRAESIITDNTVVEVTPTVEPTLEPTVEPTLEPTLEPSLSPIPTPIPISICSNEIETVLADSNWNIDSQNHSAETVSAVELGTIYRFPFDDKVSLTFNCLPGDIDLRSSLKIQRVAVSSINLPEDVVVVGDYAYDITTDMVDGTFKYSLELPKQENINAEVKYIEKDLDQIQTQELLETDLKSIRADQVTQSAEVIKASNLDHFTLFVVVNPNSTDHMDEVENQNNGWVSDNQYAIFNNRDDRAEYGFTNLGIPVGSVIDGIEVFIEGKTGGRDLDVSLWNQSGSSPDSFTTTKTADLDNSEATITLGSPTDKWGKTWTANDFDSDFMVRIDANSGGNTASLDMVQVKVYYHDPLAITLPVLPNNSSDDYALSSVGGIWIAINGGSGHTGLNTNEVRWGEPASSEKSGLRFDGTGVQTFNEGTSFLLGALTHMNWPVYGGTAANGATLQITLTFTKPGITPNPTFTYDFLINETSNSFPCDPWQISGTPCDDMITFPNSYGQQTFTIGDKLYTLKIDGFVNSYPSGSPVSQFITEEYKNNSAYLVGHLSSVLVEKPDITIVKSTNGDDAQTVPGPNLYVGDSVNWTYMVQNTGNVTLNNILVSDDKEGSVTCPKTTLTPGENMTCVKTGTAIAGQYVNTGSVKANHTSGSVSDSDISHYYGLTKGYLKVQKTTIPAGSQQEFSILASGTGTITGGGAGVITDALDKTYEVTAGTYSVSETVPSNWEMTKNTCKDIVVANGQTATCQIENTYKYAKLTVLKEVKNDNGGTKQVSDFKLYVNGTQVISGVKNDYPVNTLLTLSEDNLPGYQAGSWGGACSANGQITLQPGDDKTCTITNDDIQPRLTVNKVVNGGDKVIADFPLYVGAIQVVSGVKNGFNAGNYIISETNQEGYSASFSGDCDAQGNISLSIGDVKSCTITNTRDTGSLRVRKLTDTNADGNFELGDSGSNDLGFRWGIGAVMDQSFNTVMSGLETGSYNVNENTVPGYHFYSWFNADDPSKTCSNPDGYALPVSVNVSKGATANIVLCNTRDTGILKVQKVVDDNTDLSLWKFKLNDGNWVFADNTGLVDFGTQVTGSNYTITESGPLGYQLGSISGANCVQNINGSASASVLANQTTVCTFNNLVDKVSITVIKDAVANSNEVFDFNLTGGVSRTFQLEDDGDENDGAPSQWSISSLLPGTYTLSEALSNPEWKLTDLTCTSSLQRTIQDPDNSVTFTLVPGESMTCTFTNTQLGKVKALKYNDLDGDGDYSKDEGAFLGGWEMTLYSGFDCQGPFLDVALTQAGGPAVFAGLEPGNYSVRETMQGDWMATDGLCRNYTITAGQEQAQKFGNFQLFDITGTKYEDRNKDGDQDAQEAGIQGWTVKLYKWNDNTSSYQKVAETVTDMNGWYKFMDLGPGLYKVEEETRAGWEFVNPSSGYYTFTAVSGADKDLDFGNVSKAKIIVDKVTNPRYDSQSFQFKLSDQSGVLQSFNLTDQATAKTLYVQRGTYTVSENTPTGWMLSSVLCFDDAGLPVDVTAISLDPNETVRCAFTNTKLGSITVEKIAEPEDNEMFDFKISGGVNASFQLQDNGKKGDGFKDFKKFNNVEPVEYTITEGLESDWELIKLTCDSDKRREIESSDQSITFTLKPGEDITCKFTNEKYSEINVLKFNDYFGEGFHGSLDTPIENWGMQLYAGKNCLPSNKIGSMVYTDVNGEYRFTELLHGWYSVKEAVDPAWTNTTPLCQNTYLDAGDYDTLKFGNFKLGKVEGYKYDDINKDGDWDSDEPAVPGWKISIYKNFNNVGQTFTNGDGYYSFSNLGPGMYKVEEGEKPGWKAINPADGDYHFALISGETKRLDFGNFSWGKIVLDKDTLPKWSMEKFTLNILQDGNEIIEHELSDWSMPSMDVVSTRFTYSVTEDAKTGWELSDLVCKNQGGQVKDPAGFELKPGEMVRCDFTNTLLGKLKVVKFSDDNGDGILNNGEVKLPDWGMNLYNTDNAYTLEQTTDLMGEAFFNDLQMGHYVLSEDQQDGWDLTGIYCVDNSIQDLRPRSIDPQIAMPFDAEHLDVYPGFDSTCYVGNQELGDIIVTKFNDVNGDGIWQQGEEEQMEEGAFGLNNMLDQYSEEVLAGWMIHMEMITDNVEDDYTHLEPNFLMSKYTEETDSNGQAFFLDMPISKYRLYETQQEGWSLTNIYCELDEEDSRFSTTALLEPIEDEDYAGEYTLDLKAGEAYHCYIGNQITELYIDKTNDATAPLTIGDTTTFTIMVTLPDETAGGFTPAMLDDLMVKDLFSKGFKYITGSNKVWVNGVPIVAPVPTYNSPGTWDLSSLTLEGGDEVKIEYQVEMVDPLDEGTYKDTAWAQANTTETGNQVLALDIDEKDFFVGTEVKVAQVLEPQEVTIPEEELPRTGSNIMILVASTALAGFGFALVLLGLAKKYTSSKAFKFLMTLIGIPMVMAIAAFMGAATAYALPYLDLQVQEQPALTSLSEFDITFVTMDLQGNDITATCYYNYDPVAPAVFADNGDNDFLPSIGSDFGTGNSGACQITSLMTQFDGHYAFTVQVKTATETETKTVNVEIDRNKPLQPVAYAKTAIDNCNNRIDFTTANDGRTVSVDIFRSTATSFIADDTTRVASIAKGPGESGSYTDTIPVCGTTYYYVIQAVDAYGNRSPFRGDQIVTIIDNTSGGGTTGGTTAGGVAGEGTTAGGEEGTGAEVTPSGIAIDTDENGNVLGGTTDNTGGFNYTTFWVVIIGGLAVLGGIVYALSKKK